jgi:hypothetical protein
LQSGIQQRRKPRLGVIAARDIRMTDMRAEADRAARHGHLTKIEGITITTCAATHHDQPSFWRAKGFGCWQWREFGKLCCQFLRRGAR